jgi:hypothetical protein
MLAPVSGSPLGAGVVGAGVVGVAVGAVVGAAAATTDTLRGAPAPPSLSVAVSDAAYVPGDV